MVTLEQLKTMLHEERIKAEKVGITFRHAADPKLEIGRMQSYYGFAWYADYRIEISKYFLDAPVDDIRATIMHELLHLADGVEHGHGKSWKAAAAKINKAYPGYNIQRCGSQLVGGNEYPIRSVAANVLALKHLQSKATRKPAEGKYAVSCPQCGQIWYRSKLTRLITDPGHYYCRKCNRKLVRCVFGDKELECAVNIPA